MSLLTNANNVAFSSRFGVDKVIFRPPPGSISVPQAASSVDVVVVTIPHNLGYTPLCLGQFSDNNFSTSYEVGNPPYFYNALFAGYGPQFNCSIEADNTNVYVTFINWDTTRTLYYRLVGLIPSDITSSPKMVNADRNNFLFNANDNYMKLYLEDKLDVVTSGTGIDTYTIVHGLGYRPSIKLWSVWGGVSRIAGTEGQLGASGIFTLTSVDSQNMYIYVDTFSPETISYYYRVYLDN